MLSLVEPARNPLNYFEILIKFHFNYYSFLIVIIINILDIRLAQKTSGISDYMPELQELFFNFPADLTYMRRL